jgi:hypothetical protein
MYLSKALKIHGAESASPQKTNTSTWAIEWSKSINGITSFFGIATPTVPSG